MCGISGIINLRGKFSASELESLAVKMANTMVHRGPDDSGVWVDETGYCALSQRRLSIIDLSPLGHQPMISTDGGAAITFNGEIYNYLEIKNELEARGVVFRSKSDTEVLLEGVRKFGETIFSRMDGMYAFGHYDQRSRELVLARDPFGEKPLYYTEQNGYFAFASEIHALPVLPNFDAELDRESLAQFLAFQYVPAPRTIYRSVKKLPPGHFLVLMPNGRVEVRQHFAFRPFVDHDPERDLDELADELEAILLESIRGRLISDVPLGAFLSGGVDSSAVVALIVKALKRDIKTFSIGFEGAEESEHILAREMAAHIGSQHNEKMLSPNVMSLAQTIGRVLDEPNADSSCLPTYLLSQFTREQVTVALSGDGGDEMFGGYGRYFLTLEEEQKKRAGDSALANWTPGSAYFSQRILIFDEYCLNELLGSIPEGTKDLLANLRSRLDNTDRPLLARMREVDTDNYMPGAVLAKVDRMSMQHSLEVRCPILNQKVARFAERLHPNNCYKNGQGKLVLKQLAARYIPREWLERRKLGFGLPMNLWGREELLKSLRTLALGKKAMAEQWIGRENVERFVLKQEQPNTFSTYQVWCFLILEIWLRNHLAPGSQVEESTSIWRSIFGRRSGALQSARGLRGAQE